MNINISQNIISAFGWTVVHSLWQGVVISLILYIVLRLTSNKPANSRYLINLSSLLIFFGLTIITFINHLSFIKNDIAQVNHASLLNIESSFFSELMYQLESNINIIFYLWILGAMLLLVRLFNRQFHIYRLKTDNSKTLRPFLSKKVKQLSKNLNLTQNIEIFISKHIKTPSVVGFLKPIILFPIGLINNLNIDEIDAVIAHELAHIKRNDNLHNYIISFIEVLFYYHPMIWWMTDQIKQERENSCDEMAVGITNDPIIYAKTLCRVQEFSLANEALALHFVGSQNQFKNRIKKIIGYKQKNTIISEKLVIGLILLFGFIIMSFTNINSKPITKEQGIETYEAIDNKVIPAKIPNIENLKVEIENRDEKIKTNTIIKEEKLKKKIQLPDENIENKTIKTFYFKAETSHIDEEITTSQAPIYIDESDNIKVIINTKNSDIQMDNKILIDDFNLDPLSSETIEILLENLSKVDDKKDVSVIETIIIDKSDSKHFVKTINTGDNNLNEDYIIEINDGEILINNKKFITGNQLKNTEIFKSITKNIQGDDIEIRIINLY